MKKLFTITLALLLVLALAPNVFADDTDFGDYISQETGENLGEHNLQLVGGKAPTCTDEGKQIYQCTKCGLQYPVFSEPLSPTGQHQYVQKVRDGSSCAEPKIQYDECSVCGNIANEVVVGEPKEHTYVKDYNREPTCTENGFVYYVCSTCGYYKPEPDILPMTGHDYQEVQRVDATCTENGHVFYKCSNCDAQYTKFLWSTGHDYQKVTKEATCTEAGYSYKECTKCGNKINKTTTEALGHDYKEVVTKEATCTENGSSYKECTKCGDRINETTEALGHDYSGNRYVCARCGEKIEIQITFSKVNITKAPEEEKKEEEQKEEEKEEEQEVIVIISYDDEDEEEEEKDEEEKPLTRSNIQEDCPHENIRTKIGDTGGSGKDYISHTEYKCEDCGKIWNEATHYYFQRIKQDGCHYTATCACGVTKTYTLHDHLTSAAHYTGKKSVKKVNGKAQIVYEVEVYRYCTTCKEKTESITWYVSSKDSWTSEWNVSARNLYNMEDEYPEIEAYWPQEVRRFIKKSKTQPTRN